MAQTPAPPGGTDRPGRTSGTHQSQLSKQLSSLTDLLAWQAQLEKRQSEQPQPARICGSAHGCWFRVRRAPDLAVGNGLLPNNKAPNGQTATALCAHLSKSRRWVKVGQNAEMLGWGEYRLRDCPYPLTAAMERFKVGRRFKYAVLLHRREEHAPFPTLPVWFQHYNPR